MRHAEFAEALNKAIVEGNEEKTVEIAINGAVQVASAIVSIAESLERMAAVQEEMLVIMRDPSR